jgi:hypothetical protein
VGVGISHEVKAALLLPPGDDRFRAVWLYSPRAVDPELSDMGRPSLYSSGPLTSAHRH